MSQRLPCTLQRWLLWSAVFHAEQAPVDANSAPAPDVSNTALALVVGYIAPAPADTSSTPVYVGDTDFDTSWGRHCRQCEVFRIGDRDYEGQVQFFFMPMRTPTLVRRARGYPVASQA